MQVPVSARSLPDMDRGAAGLMIDAAIREAVRDVEDRGDDFQPRKVNIILTFKMLDNGAVACHIEAEAKVPKRRTAATVGVVRSNNDNPKLIFQTQDPDDPTQRCIDEVEDAARKG